MPEGRSGAIGIKLFIGDAPSRSERAPNRSLQRGPGCTLQASRSYPELCPKALPIPNSSASSSAKLQNVGQALPFRFGPTLQLDRGRSEASVTPAKGRGDRGRSAQVAQETASAR